MRKNSRKYILLIPVLCGILVACEGDNQKSDIVMENNSEVTEPTGLCDTFVVGVEKIGNTYNPLLSYNPNDEPIISAVFANICGLDEEGNLTDEAGNIKIEEIVNEDGNVQYLYTVSLREGMLFSDGEPVTIDDVLAYYYICADPTYNGPSDIKNLDIVGLQEYYYDVNDTVQLLAELENYRQDTISEENFVAYIEETNAEGWFDGVAMSAGGPAGDGSITWGEYCAMCGVATVAEANDIQEDAGMLSLLAQAEWSTDADSYEPYSYYRSKAALDGVEDGIDIDKITGITRVDDYTCTVLFNSFDISAEKELAYIPIIPEHYYCEGFEKGNIQFILEKDVEPMGSGEYIVTGYENNAVCLKANENYFEGCPQIPNLEFRVVSEEDKLDAVVKGDITTVNMNFSKDSIEALNQHTEEVSYQIVGEDGYGYIGIHAESVNDLNIRKGLMHLMDRKSAVDAYYGENGTIVERPLIPTLAEYPQAAKEYYPYDVEQALEYFQLAGYAQVDGKLINAEGKQLKLVAGISKDSDQPLASVFTQMSEDMASIGAELEIRELTFKELFIQVLNGKLDMWGMTWERLADCDLAFMFGSKGEWNYYKYSSEEIDNIQKEIVQTKDYDKRCELVSKELDLLMEGAVCMPVYQKKHIEIRMK